MGGDGMSFFSSSRGGPSGGRQSGFSGFSGMGGMPGGMGMSMGGMPGMGGFGGAASPRQSQVELPCTLEDLYTGVRHPMMTARTLSLCVSACAW